MLTKHFFTRTVLKSLVTLVVIGFFLIPALRSAQTKVADRIGQEPSQEGLEFFEKKIRPVLAESCSACHSAQSKKPQGGLMLDSIEGMLKGGASGQPAVVPGDPEKSLLIKAIRYADAKLQMPLGGKLPDQVIKDFEAWVKMGAPAPRISSPNATASNWQSYDWDAAKKFWSFQPIKKALPPQVKNRSWAKTPIDQFVLAKLEEKGLKPLGDTDRRSLIRRATFDLMGLPPSPEEIEAFLNDRSTNAFEKVVDRLLASSAYGEKWGRHWLDLVRYADTAGDNSDYPVPAAYRYRNYVIEAFNKDKPYDQFIREQIAGDIIARHRNPRVEGKLSEEEEDEPEVPGSKKMLATEIEQSRQEKIIATGYLAMSRRFGSRNKEMNLTIDDTIDNLGKTFLGLSASCARCHDHKFDPIPQRDYYALYGIFNSIRYSFPGAEIYPHPAEMVALVSGKESEKFYKLQNELEYLDDRKEFLTAEKGTAARNKKMKEQQAKEAETKAAETKSEIKSNNESGAQATVEQKKDEPKTELRAADFDRDGDNWGRAGQSKRMPEEVDAEMRLVKARIAELHAQYTKVPKAYAVVEGLPANARIHRKGDPKNLGEEAPRGFLTILGGQRVPVDGKGSGRQQLANWIADSRNPLTARVMVNRVWQYHFGKGLVQTPNDFGTRGKAPTHPELLDYLAARFVEEGWSIKKMHKTIMLSRVYQLASGEERAGERESGRAGERVMRRRSGAVSTVNEKIDVNNDYLWRFNRRRLEAEEIRDAILAVSGQLDRTMGAEHSFPPETTWRFSQHVQFFAVYETNRRSVYIMQQRLKKHPFFEVFDGADQNAITGERAQSITPVQALFLMNNQLMHEQADQLAVRVGMAYDTMPERIDYAFRLAYGRSAKPEEMREAVGYLQQTKQELTKQNISTEKLTRMALASYCRVLLSSNEFLYVD
jgi:hypothetical protein